MEILKTEAGIITYLLEGEAIIFAQNGVIMLMSASAVIAMWTDYMHCVTWLQERFHDNVGKGK